MMIDRVMSFRKLVKPEDLNPANRLFGGRIMEWADEAAAVYAMCQMRTKNIVTLKVSEILFKTPAQQGDILEFVCQKKRVGSTSMTIELKVFRKEIPKRMEHPDIILQCDFTFVALGPDGRPTPYSKIGLGKVAPPRRKTKRK